MPFDSRARHPDNRRGVWLRAAVIVLAGVGVYLNGLSAPFLLDDENSIVGNSSIRQLWPPGAALSPPKETPVAARPIVNLTFALNYAASGLDATAYRATNLAIHLLTALVLLGIVRRTLLLPKLERAFPPPSPVREATRINSAKTRARVSASAQVTEARSRALNLAFACALVWALHPLNTEPVNYLSQRSELLMALFYLLTLYCALRGSGIRDQGSGMTNWQVAAVVSCAAGMACKESMVTAPVIVVLYDRVFLFDSMRDALRHRWRLYVGLAASWLVLAALMLGKPRTTAGFDSGVDPWSYFLNQIEIIVHYLRLSVWPRALVIDYGLPRALTIGDVVLPAVFLTALGVATVAALRYWPLAGFLGAWFFITLAPTSSFVPIATEVGAERRMYLPLAGLVVFIVIGAYALITRHAGGRFASGQERRLTQVITGGALIVICALLALGTFDRNREYESRLSIAQTNVERWPHGRAHFHLGAELVYAGQHDKALDEFRISARDYPGAHYALATEFAVAGQAAEAAKHAREFIRLMPHDSAAVPARELLARALASEGQMDAAAEQLTLIVEQAPENLSAHVLLADIRLEQNRAAEAITQYEAARRLRPRDPEVLGKLGRSLAISGRMREAVEVFEHAVGAHPNDATLLSLLGRALAADGRFSEATARFRRVVELKPGDAEAAHNLAMAIAEQSAAR